MVNAFLEELFRFESLVVETTSDCHTFEYVEFIWKWCHQTIVKRWKENSSLILVAKVGVLDHGCLCKALKEFFKEEKCNSKGVIGVTVSEGQAQFHLYDPITESLTLYGPSEGLSIMALLRSKIYSGLKKNEIVEKQAKKIASELIAEIVEERPGLGEKVVRQIRNIAADM